MTNIQARLDSVRKQIHETASTCSQPSPKLLVVSKYHSVQAITEAYQYGQRQFGENYVQELVEKAKQLPMDVEFHLIGHLQTNKCKDLLRIPNVKRISSVDSIHLAKKLETICVEFSRTVEVLVQIGATGEKGKTGIPFEEAKTLIFYILMSCPHLHFEGLMTLGHLTDDDKTIECFKQVSLLKNQLIEEFSKRWPENSIDRPHLPVNFELSMGMSSDIKQAIECGSTEVRIGTAIFGVREQKS